MASIAIWLFFAYLANVSVFASASSAEVSPKDKDKSVCTTKLDVCSMKVENEPLKISLTSSTQGPKGDQGLRGPIGPHGDRGYPGVMGLIGPPGRRGEDGFPGNDGPPGIMGEKGDPGLPGRDGLPGMHGPPGDQGDAGFPGIKGPKGDKGLRGAKGIIGAMGFPGFKGEIGSYGTTGHPGAPGKQGPPGPPGINGSCPCYSQKVQRDDVLSEEEDEDGSMTLLNNLCRYASIPIKNRNRYLMGPEKVEVICDDRDGAMFSFTCVPPVKDAKLKMLTFSSATKPYWLKKTGESIKDLYGLTRTQIAWMHERSDGAYQKLRIHSKNTMPYYPDERSLLMLSWNDITFGPTPTKTTPFVYTVPSESDTCLNATYPDVCQSIIEIDSDSFQRLPVVNFLIRDLKDEEISIGIEPLELCFY